MMYVCIHIRTYIYTYIYIHINTHTHTHTHITPAKSSPTTRALANEMCTVADKNPQKSDRYYMHHIK